MTYVDSSWAFKRGDLVRVDDSTLVANPGIVRVRWGTDDYSGWYSSNDLYRVKLK
jgi:hypothetical protein